LNSFAANADIHDTAIARGAVVGAGEVILLTYAGWRPDI